MTDTLIIIRRQFIIALFVLLTPMAPAEAQQHADDTLLVRAAFIYNFTKFTHWPEKELSPDNPYIDLCIAGKDALSDELLLLDGKGVRGHSLRVQHLREQTIPSHCKLLYIATSEKQRYPQLLESLQQRAVLTISELSHFARHGGSIELYKRDAAFHFIVNLDNTDAAGLQISSRLLSLAKIIGKQEAR